MLTNTLFTARHQYTIYSMHILIQINSIHFTIKITVLIEKHTFLSLFSCYLILKTSLWRDKYKNDFFMRPHAHKKKQQ